MTIQEMIKKAKKIVFQIENKLLELKKIWFDVTFNTPVDIRCQIDDIEKTINQ